MVAALPVLDLRHGLHDSIAVLKELRLDFSTDPRQFRRGHIPLVWDGHVVDKVRILVRVLSVVTFHDQEIG